MAAYPLLMYHKVARCPRGAVIAGHYVHLTRFARQMEWLKRLGWRGMTMQEMAERIANGEQHQGFGLTFDDGYENYFLNALPVLEKAQFHSTVFVVTGQIGGTNVWDLPIGETVERLIDLDQLKKIANQGHEIGSHSVNHVKLREVSDETARSEIVGSKAQLEQLLNSTITSFCYPYGSIDRRAQEIVKEAGYQSACSTRKGWNDETTDCTQWRRINVRKDTSTPLLLWKIETARRRYPRID